MIIEKIKNMPGWWSASTRINGEFFTASSPNKLDALDRLFRVLEWNEVGNWNKDVSN